MRLFVAIDVDAATRHAAEAFRKRICHVSPAGERDLRWVEPGNLHMTLRFLGERDDADLVREVLSAGFQQPRFSMSFGQAAWLPGRGRPRVLFVAVEEGAVELASLAEEVSARLATIGVAREERPFTAHLTLARVRDSADPLRLRHLSPALSDFKMFTSVMVSTITLYESRLTPRGPAYHVQQRTELT